MAQFEFLGMHGDSWAFVQKIGESQAVKAIVDLKYETREAIILEATDSRLEAFVKGRKRLYFTGPFTEFPLEFREIRLEQGVRYCVDEKRGGPLIGFIPAASFPEGGMTFLNTGTVNTGALDSAVGRSRKRN